MTLATSAAILSLFLLVWLRMRHFVLGYHYTSASYGGDGEGGGSGEAVSISADAILPGHSRDVGRWNVFVQEARR